MHTAHRQHVMSHVAAPLVVYAGSGQYRITRDQTVGSRWYRRQVDEQFRRQFPDRRFGPRTGTSAGVEILVGAVPDQNRLPPIAACARGRRHGRLSSVVDADQQ